MKMHLVLGLVLSSMAAFANPDICVGDRVIDNANDAGRVIEVYSNGKAKVKFDRFSNLYTKNLKDISKSIRCKGRLCVGNRVLDNANDVGTIHEIFANGKVNVKFDRFSKIYTKLSSDLGKGYRCVEAACVRDRIIDNSNDSGIILEVFDNGKAKVKFDRFSNYYVKSLKDLGYGISCIGSNSCRGRD